MMNIKGSALAMTLLLCALLSNAQSQFLESRFSELLVDWKYIKGVQYNAASNEYDDSDWQDVQVPHTYSLDAINEVGYYKGEVWYRTAYSLPIAEQDKRVFIRFQAVGQEAVVYINGQRVGQHIGGYSAFCYEITNQIIKGSVNLIAVQVNNKPSYKRIPANDELFNHYGGIYRPVEIFTTPQANISPLIYASPGIFVTQKSLGENAATVEIKTYLSHTGNKNGDEYKLNYVLKNQKGESVASKQVSIKSIDHLDTLVEQFSISNPIRWNGKKQPHLYNVSITLKSEDFTDQVSQYFGLRSYHIDDNKGFILNDKPYRLQGVAMHQEWQQTGPALSPEQHKEDFSIIREIGASSVRLSHYQHSDATYENADRYGILLWTEIPFVHDYTGREQSNAKQQLRELIHQKYNHPSIYAWGIWNEVRAWVSKDEPPVALTKELVNLAHTLDPNRFTVSASDRGLISNMGNITDYQAWNKYYGWYYGEYEDMAKWLDDSRAEYPDINLGISEYGIGGNIYQQDRSKLEKPSGRYFPEPEQTRYHEITWNIIKDRPFVWSSYVWNLFDFSVASWNRGGIPNLNHKGLVTYDRSTKKDAFYYYKSQWSDQPTLHITGRRDSLKDEKVTNIKVFTNCSALTLWVNGKKTANQKIPSTVRVAIFENIELEEGTNQIKVVSKDKKIEDEITVYYDR
ncbi:MAG: hypothetical protein JXR10_12940 [Cyclobacteriaceae bacterium]